MSVGEITIIASVFMAASSMVFLLVAYIDNWKVSYPAALRARIEAMEGREQFQNLWIFKQRKESGVRFWNKETIEPWLCRLTEQANVPYTPNTMITWCLGLGLAAGLVVIIFGNMFLMPLASLVAWLPIIYLYYRRRIRRNRLAKQLPSAFHALSRTVRAGQTIPAAMQMVAETFESPISDEFALCCHQQTLGVSRETALRELAQRTSNMEIQIFVVALLVHSRTGGDIMTLFDNLASMARKRHHFEQRVKALTGEGRMQAIMLMALPIVAFIALYLISPDYLNVLIERPWVLVCAGVLQLIGSLWIRSIVRIEV